MDQAAREYELVLMLDPGLEDASRDKLAQDARTQIESGGTLRQENTWGLRKLAYEIHQRTEADYRWFRFQAERQLLDSLDHNLKIADGVLRFRIFKADPDSPVVEAPTAGGPPPARTGGPDRGRAPDRGGPPERASAPEPAAAPEEPAAAAEEPPAAAEEPPAAPEEPAAAPEEPEEPAEE